LLFLGVYDGPLLIAERSRRLRALIWNAQHSRLIGTSSISAEFRT